MAATAKWLRDTGALFKQYLAVGVTFALAGTLYGILARFSKSNAVPLICLGIGFWLAHLVWASHRDQLIRSLAEGYSEQRDLDVRIAFELGSLDTEGI